jgi:AbrB family looped-hinge helix DNA binding protein
MAPIPITRIRAKGQITLPRQVRETAHLEEGDPIEVEVVAEGILLRPKKVIDSTQAWFWTEAWQHGETAASEDIAAGRTRIHKSTEDFLAALSE